MRGATTVCAEEAFWLAVCSKTARKTTLRVMRELDDGHLGTIPTATGGIARLAYAQAKNAGVDVGLFLKKSGITRREIEDRDARVSVRRQIRFLNLVADVLNDEFLGSDF